MSGERYVFWTVVRAEPVVKKSSFATDAPSWARNVESLIVPARSRRKISSASAVCETIEGEAPPPRGNYFGLTLHEPYGAVAAITPWNSPLTMEAQKIAPALAAGNAVLLKPSEVTPGVGLIVARLALEAGLPPGLLRSGFQDTGVSGLWRDNEMKLVPYALYRKEAAAGQEVRVNGATADYVVLVKE